jgi:predicted nucleic acid-binding protein
MGMVMMGDKAFVDTNILLRALIPQLPLHQDCEALIQQMWEDDVELWISRQVIREYLVQVTHPRTLTIPATTEQICNK